MVGRLERVLIKHPRDAFISQEHLNQNWRTFNYSSCPDFGKALEEYRIFEEILKQHVPVVNYLPRDSNVGIDSIYTHDSVKITKNGAILLNMGKESRKNEPLAVKESLNELNIPVLGTIKGSGRVEGGDMLWIDEENLVVGRGYRTNDEGIKQLKTITSDIVDEFIITQLPHGDGPDACLHLMSLISLIDENLAVVYSKLMPVPFREMLLEKSIELLEVPDREYTTLGCNILALAPRKCIIVGGNLETRRMLEDTGIEVYEYAGEEISLKGTGGPTCLACPVVRK
ncbi:MAG: dimethylarginine dimethylaminohydrolase family protein [Candidatus Odinarchaeota archaeon]